jgi:hypothetical protein
MILEDPAELGLACEEATTLSSMVRASRGTRDQRITTLLVLLPVAQSAIDLPTPMPEEFTKTIMFVQRTMAHILAAVFAKDRDITPSERHRPCL